MIRDLTVNLLILVCWWWYIDYSPFSQHLTHLRFNRKKPDSSALWREVPNTISTILCGTFWEVVCLYLYANGTITNYFMTDNLYNDIMDNKLSWFLIIGLN